MKQPFEDDGRTICPMDVDGMPDSPFRMNRRQRREDKAELKRKVAAEEAMTQKEARRYSWYAILAGLTVIGIVGGGTVLFIFLLTLIW